MAMIKSIKTLHRFSTRTPTQVAVKSMPPFDFSVIVMRRHFKEIKDKGYVVIK